MSLGRALVRWTAKPDGDFHNLAEGLEQRRRNVVDRPWSTLRQVHGARVFVVNEPGAATAEQADALLTDDKRTAVAVRTADCASIALASPEGLVAAVHAGWRGLVAGVIEAAAAAMRAAGASELSGALGPCIHPECYEFSETDLSEISQTLGPEVCGETASGRPALDLPKGVRTALARSRVELVHDADVCTACSPHFWSHRAGDRERQAMVAWLP